MNMDLRFYWKLVLRRAPAMAGLFLLCAGLGVALAFKLPTTFETSAQLLVEQPQIDDVGITQIAAAEQLEIIEQRLMTRSNLIDIAYSESVFAQARNMSPDDIVKEMRKNTKIRRSSGRNQATLMSISFEAESARVAAAVVNRYVTLVLNENVRLRTDRAEDNLDFFNQEVTRLGSDLDSQSERILEFKAANADALPDGQEYRLSRQDLLQERSARIEREISQLGDQRKRIVAVYEATGSLQGPSERRLTPEEQQLRDLQSELSAARAIYSETNPKVSVLRSRIAKLETVVAAQGGASGAGEDDELQQNSLLQVTLAQIDAQVETRETELLAVNSEFAELREAIARTPANQIALFALERDYENLQSQYNAAIERRNQARMGERIELSSKGQRISVIEQASTPTEPASPNRPLIVAAGVSTGLASAAGLFFLLELLNRSVRRPAEITNALGITPLVAIPVIESVARKRIRRLARIATLLLVIVTIPAILWAVDTYYRPLDLLLDRLLTGLSLK